MSERRGRLVRAGLSWCLLLAALLGVVPRAFGQEVRHVRHILVRTEKEARDLMTRVQAGEDFVELARKYSFDVVTKKLGGDLGWVGRGGEPEFDRATFSIPREGGVAVARTKYGWHLIQVVETKQIPGRQPAPEASTRPASGDTSEQPAARRLPPVRGEVNEDLSIELTFEKKAYLPGEPVKFTIRMQNNIDKPLNVFNPDLWPLGLTVRYQEYRKGPFNRPMKQKPGTEQMGSDAILRTLPGGEFLGRTFTLQDYAGELDNWPLIRVNWRSNIFFQQLERFYPAITEHEDYLHWKARWRFYHTGETHINVLPDLQSESRWFAQFYVTRGKLWIELRDPGVPGVLQHWVDLIRNGLYWRVPFASRAEGKYLLSEGQSSERPVEVDKFGIKRIRRLEAHKSGMVSLAIERDPSRGEFLGAKLYFALDDPGVLNGRAVPVGRVLSGYDAVQRISQMFGTSGRRPRISLATLYTYDLLPDNVKGIVDGKVTPPQSRAPQPGASPRAGRAQVPVIAWGPNVPEPGAGNLPRVELVTDQGSIEIELFEDHAPNTVANFVYLVEQGFYNGLTFHRKEQVEGNKGYIQGGSPDGTDLGGPGYAIKDEKSKIRHLRGGVGLARLRNKKNSGGCQFYICLEAQPWLDAEWTVFGRIVRGMEIADSLKEGSVIKSAKLLHKRDHPYQPEKINQ